MHKQPNGLGAGWGGRQGIEKGRSGAGRKGQREKPYSRGIGVLRDDRLHPCRTLLSMYTCVYTHRTKHTHTRVIY